MTKISEVYYAGDNVIARPVCATKSLQAALHRIDVHTRSAQITRQNTMKTKTGVILVRRNVKTNQLMSHNCWLANVIMIIFFLQGNSAELCLPNGWNELAYRLRPGLRARCHGHDYGDGSQPQQHKSRGAQPSKHASLQPQFLQSIQSMANPKGFGRSMFLEICCHFLCPLVSYFSLSTYLHHW